MVAAVVPIGLLVFTRLTGISISAMPSYLWSLFVEEFDFLIVSGLSDSIRVTTFGLGPGMDSNAAADSGGVAMYRDFGGRWRESFFAKSWLELGIVGFSLSIVLIVCCLYMAFKFMRSSRDPWAAGMAAFVLALTSILPKGSIIERAPAGVYFWVAVGILALKLERENDAFPSELVKRLQSKSYQSLNVVKLPGGRRRVGGSRL